MTSLVFGMFLSIGAGFTILGLSVFWYGQRTRKWPATDGVVRRVASQLGSWGKVKYLELLVEYEYAVAGHSYRSSQLGIGHWIHMEPDLLSLRLRETYEESVARDELGDLEHLTVYYNPRNPKQAVLRLGPGQSVWLWLGIGLVNLVVSLAFL